MENTKNNDGSPVTVYSPAYHEETEVSNWQEYYYYQVWDGTNDDYANGVSHAKAWNHEPESQMIN